VRDRIDALEWTAAERDVAPFLEPGPVTTVEFTCFPECHHFQEHSVLAHSAVATLVAITLCVSRQAAPPVGGDTPHAAPVLAEHVRSTNARVRNALREGELKSATFRELLAHLQQSDVILHIEAGDCTCNRAKACLSFVAQAGPVRYIRATVSLRQIQKDVVEQIGHELRHAVELADAPEVIDPATLRQLYTRIGRSSCGSPCGYETREALRAQSAVRAELQAAVLDHPAGVR
jgi:hypothetical protein